MQLDHQEILKLLPHRYPFILVDRILELQPGVFIKGLKNVTLNEPHFLGHFPDNPIFPGVLILEAMAQTGIIFAKVSDETLKDKLVLFAGIDEARFRRTIVPGDQIIMELTLLKKKSNVWKMQGKAFVDNSIVTECILTAAVK